MDVRSMDVRTMWSWYACASSVYAVTQAATLNCHTSTIMPSDTYGYTWTKCEFHSTDLVVVHFSGFFQTVFCRNDQLTVYAVLIFRIYRTSTI